MIPFTFQYDLFRIVAPIMAVGSFGFMLAGLSSTGRRNPAVGSYTVFAAITIGYLLSNTMEISSGSSGESLFWSQLIYLFIGFMPIVWLDFSLRFTREGRGIPRPLLAIVCLFPLGTLIVVFSPRLSPLMWPSIEWFRQGGFVLSVRSHGPWFIFYAAYTYGFFLAGAVIVARAFVLYRSFYRKQARTIFVGIAVPLATSLIYVLRPIPGLTKDFTPLGYAAAVAFFYIALFRRALFSLAPVARSLVIERMQDGVLVLDKEGRVADANAAALSMFQAGEAVVGKLFRAVDFGADRFIAAADGGKAVEFSQGTGDSTRHYSALSMRLGDRVEGVVVVVRDVTEAKNLLARVESLASTDELTGLPNRRSFMIEADRELATSRRYGTPLSVAMFDLDHFKAINDEYGHAAGDAGLREFGHILAAEIRKDDAAGRIGGEEFAVILWNADLEASRSICERIRTKVESKAFESDDGRTIRMTVSAGLVSFAVDDANLDCLLIRADRALYEAKNAGRNRVVARR